MRQPRDESGRGQGCVDIRFRWEGDPRLERLYYTAVCDWTAPDWRMRAGQSTLRADAQG